MRQLYALVSMLLVTSGLLTVRPSSAESLLTHLNNKQEQSPSSTIDLFSDQGRRAGTRTGFCMIAPYEYAIDTWSLQPTFAWMGSATQIQIVDDATGETIWTQLLSSEQQYISYTDTALQAGQDYYVVISYDPLDEQGNPTGRTTTDDYLLSVKDETNRSRIAAELEQIQVDNPTLSEAELQQERISYFIAQNMWLDTVRELFSGSTSGMPTSEQIMWQRSFCGLDD